MATMLPTQPPPGTSGPERRAFDCLARLPPEWTVFHSVPWFGDLNQGEGDFVVVGPQGGLVFLEVKGKCRVGLDGQWTRRNSNIVVKDPWAQAQSTGREITARLRRAGLPRRPAAYVACFPVGDPQFAGGLALQSERSLSADILEDSERLESVLDQTLRDAAIRDSVTLNAFTPAENDLIRSVLLVTGQVHVPLPSAVLDGAGRRAELTARQTEVYVNLMRTSRLLTLGPAGTGKTILAAARAAQLSRQGIGTLFLVAHWWDSRSRSFSPRTARATSLSMSLVCPSSPIWLDPLVGQRETFSTRSNGALPCEDASS